MYVRQNIYLFLIAYTYVYINKNYTWIPTYYVFYSILYSPPSGLQNYTKIYFYFMCGNYFVSALAILFYFK